MSVLDASVVLKWVVDEEDSDKALEVREEYFRGTDEVVVPDLLLYEIANALRYHSGFGVDEIKSAVGTLFDMGIEIVAPTRSLLDRAVDISKADNITCYDAVYLALAEDIDELFVTADEKLANSLSEGRRKRVRLLREL